MKKWAALLFFSLWLCMAKSQYKVYVFLGENCPICQYHTLTLNQLHQKYSAQGIEIIGVFPNPDSDSAAIENFRQEYKVAFSLQKDTGRRLMKQFGATITPQAFITRNDSVYYNGRIDDRFAALGKRKTTPTLPDLENAIVALLHGQALVVKETTAIGCFIDSEY